MNLRRLLIGFQKSASLLTLQKSQGTLEKPIRIVDATPIPLAK